MIYFAGDTHGDQRWLGRVAAQYCPAAIVHLGDIELQEPPETAFAEILENTTLYWVAGNHDYDREEYFRGLDAPVLRSGALHCRIRLMDGLRLAGLGGWFQAKVWRPPNEPVESEKAALRHLHFHDADLRMDALRLSGAIWWEDYIKLRKLRADVLVTHEAPSYHRMGFQAIDDLAKAMGASRIFHGHLNKTHQSLVGDGIRVYGVGLRAIVDIDGGVIRPGEQNQAWRRRNQQESSGD